MTQIPSLQRSIAIGAIGFGLVSLCVFATVAFAERWMYQTLGLTGAYLVWTVLFIVLSGAVFGSLVVTRWRLPKFYILWGLAFFAYAVAWMVAYFTMPNAAGELVGALAGSVLMAVVFAAGFGSLGSTLKLSAVLFVSNALGYFIGSSLNNTFRAEAGMLLWGVAYGLFFGAGIGAVLYLVQQGRANHRCTMSSGEFLTRGTIWVAIAAYAIGCVVFATARRPNADRWARLAWTVGCGALLTHFISAYHFFHDWSHASAYADTARQTAEVFRINWGGGLFINYAVASLWFADVTWWWFAGLDSYRRRPWLITILWHGFLIFILFNATVVFKDGLVRWIGLFVCVILVVSWYSIRNEFAKR